MPSRPRNGNCHPLSNSTLLRKGRRSGVNTYMSTQICDAHHRTVAVVRGTITRVRRIAEAARNLLLYRYSRALGMRRANSSAPSPPVAGLSLCPSTPTPRRPPPELSSGGVARLSGQTAQRRRPRLTARRVPLLCQGTARDGAGEWRARTATWRPCASSGVSFSVEGTCLNLNATVGRRWWRWRLRWSRGRRLRGPHRGYAD
jgi:hypothetical protein